MLAPLHPCLAIGEKHVGGAADGDLGGIRPEGPYFELPLDFRAKAYGFTPAETERYIVWPGQALGYKIGQLEITKLRHEAEEALGPKFDIKGFHRVVLTAGQVPLPVLRDLVMAWVAQRKAG